MSTPTTPASLAEVAQAIRNIDGVPTGSEANTYERRIAYSKGYQHAIEKAAAIVDRYAADLAAQAERAAPEGDAFKAIDYVIRRLQADVDAGSRPDQWSMEDMIRSAKIARAALAAQQAAPAAAPEPGSVLTAAERDKVRAAIMDEMSPLARMHHQWYGWPGTFPFAEAAIRLIYKRAALAAPSPAAPEAQPAPAVCVGAASADRDAYEGAREDLLDWKRRALKAEDLVRKFAASVNGPTFMGEPVRVAQPVAQAVPVAHAHVYSDSNSFNDNETVRRVRVVFVDPVWQYKQPDGATVSLYAAPVQAVPAREVARQVFALCESFEDTPDSPADSHSLERFKAGQRFTAKRIRNAIGDWLTGEERARKDTAPPAQAVPKVLPLVKRLRLLEADHAPHSYPPVTMQEVSALCAEIERLGAAGVAGEQNHA